MAKVSSRNRPGIEMRQVEAPRVAFQDGEKAIEKTRQTEDETCAALRGIQCSKCTTHWIFDPA